MKTALYLDCCIRARQSRTREVSDAFFSALSGEYHVIRLDLTRENLQPLMGKRFEQRESLIKNGNLSDSCFARAHQFAGADLVIIAAPFWDLSFPALLKLYFEDISVEGITFRETATGHQGLCRGTHLVFLTTRGGLYAPGDPMEQGTPYLAALQKFYGFDSFSCIAADGLDVQGYDGTGALHRACAQAAELAKTL
ncbi:MAG: NAD(P)H-dependent oxidoreductase [Oscillibacter sp.]|jgi:FMN-dependent NADH-azoreductase|nr:NAD(P)H-dependent oxidoreductase [Oscillibacter sp.]